ncbi:MAG: cyclohexanone monooxygenase [Chloroflexi bacterium]|nr:MAG: cyclohexanone monooxygenase [Chloroflexota bacterium]
MAHAGFEPVETGEFDAVVIGAGLAGLYMLYRLRELGLATIVFETGDGVGGTWYWNRYPGARCDSPSLFYSYSFSPELLQEWSWSSRYPTQAEILSYINHVADRFDLRRDIRFNARVTTAAYDDARRRWVVETERGDRVSAKYCIAAVGCLSAGQAPKIPGLESFRGEWYHTGAWPHEPVELRGKRIGVVGTGSSGVQVIPTVAPLASHLYVFQRTANFSIPARNAPRNEQVERETKAHYAELWKAIRMTKGGLLAPPATAKALDVSEEERQRVYEERWAAGGSGFAGAFTDLLTDTAANDTAADFVRSKIRATVADPVVAEALCPKDHPLGTKRLVLDTDYFETYNRPNVTLVDVRKAPIQEITPTGIRTADAEYELDMIIFATGYNAMTGPLLSIDIRGQGGVQLREKWQAGPRTYLGVSIAGFPNLFTITGPGSPSVLTNMVVAIEQHVEWVADCIDYLEEHHIAAIEPDVAAEDAWVEHVNEKANATLYPLANSWYMGANIPGKPRVFMPYVGGLDVYTVTCNEIAAEGYRGFALTTG